MTTSTFSSLARPRQYLELEYEYGIPRIKRVLDVAVSLVALIVSLPLFLLIALAIRIDSRGPVFYAQKRVGIDRRRGDRMLNGEGRRKKVGYGRPFRVYKFRSMIVNAEKSTGPVWALRKDPRATRVGAFLRRTHLDEVPQFFNVLRGDMAIVGPRPERPQLVRSLVAQLPEYALRSRVLPGITGLAQIRNGYDDSLESAARKVEYDLYYMQNASLGFDLQIMASTAVVLVRGKEKA